MNAIKTMTAAVALLAVTGCAMPTPQTQPSVQIASATNRIAPPPPAPPAPVHSVAIEYYNKQPMVRVAVPNVGSFRCILDTGADDLTIPASIVKQLFEMGLSDQDVSVIGTSRAGIAGGGSIETLNIMLRQVNIGPWAIRTVPATVVAGGNCLLGMSILKSFGRPVIDFAGQRLVLED